MAQTPPNAPKLPHAQTRFADKIARIRAGGYRPGDFMIADAKDADTAGGILSTGRRRDATGAVIGNRSRAEFLDQMRALIAQDVIDILLASSGNIEALVDSRAFDGSAVMAAFRGNEATDAWVNVRGGRYRDTPSLPHRGADLSLARAALALYSITFVNDAVHDAAALRAYADFRADARANGVMHFLEVFNSNVPTGVADEDMGAFVNDCILRALSSLTRAEYPEFLKIAYNGPAALEELAAHDPAMVVGVLGGGSGTHRDTFELVAQAERYGARLALFGRKINGAEHQPTLIAWMRRVADRDITPSEAVNGYHGDLARAGLRPDRELDSDIQITENVLKSGAN